MKKITYLILGLLLIGLCIFISKQSTKGVGEPEAAVKKFAIEQRYKDAEHLEFSNDDRAPDSGGYFILGQFPDQRSQLFYTWMEDNKWNVINICEVNLSESTTMLSGNPSLTDGSQVPWGFSMIFLNGKPSVQSVVGYTRLSTDQKAKPIPFSFTKVGSFSIWVHKFPQNIGGTDYYQAYDHLGNEVWRSQ